MFTVTAKGVYGLAALLDLSDNYRTGPRQIRDIAEAHGIPQHYLEQILVALKKAGLVESYRGAQGGYALARHPAQVSVLDALTQLEGKLEVLSDQRKDNALAFFWLELEEKIHQYLDRNLEDILMDQKKHKQQLYYEI